MGNITPHTEHSRSTDVPVEDVLRDHLEKAEVLAEEGGFDVIQHLLAMALMELNELDGLGRIEALILREKSRSKGSA